MENASKALLMAAGILMGILVLSLAVFLFANFGSTSSQIRSDITSNQLTQFNTQFTIYAGRDDITIYDIISVANLAKENNKNYSSYSDYQIQVIVNNIMGYSRFNKFQDSTEADIKRAMNEFSNVISDENGRTVIGSKFKCENITYHENGRVATITFRKIN